MPDTFLYKFNSSAIRFSDEQYLLNSKCNMPQYSELLDQIPFLAKMDADLQNGIMEKLQKINRVLREIGSDEKVVIYGGGAQTAFFLRFADIQRLNIIRVVDKKRTPVFDIDVQDSTYENLKDADVIIVTPHFAAKEIKRYLDKIRVKGKILCLSDICNGVLITAHENKWAPDLTKINDREWSGQINVSDVTEKINQISTQFLTVRKNEIYKSLLPETNKKQEFEMRTAIVIQGPIVAKEDFTLNTIKLYHHYFPLAKIIVSVWEDDENVSNLGDISGYNAEIVFAAKPICRGYQGVNLQLATSYAGIFRAKQLGCDYAFKTRSDMRYYSADMIALMQWYIQEFPLRKKDVPQKERLVIFPPRYDYCFFFCDFFMFGHVDDMMNYWDINRSFSDDYTGESAETMLAIRYAQFIGKDIENSLQNIKEYAQVVFDYFAVVDDKMLFYVWNKYFYHKQWEHEYHYNIINFVDWYAKQFSLDVQSDDVELDDTDKLSVISAKKVLYFVTHTLMDSLYLNQVDLSDIELKLVREQVRDGQITQYCNYLCIDNKGMSVEIVQPDDLEWAEEIWLLSGNDNANYILQKYNGKNCDKFWLKSNPYVEVQKVYRREGGLSFEVWNKFYENKAVSYELDWNDVVFVEEALMSNMNKAQTNVFYTYSMGARDLICGVYFDEKEISTLKNYAIYNQGVKVIVYGEMNAFVEESIVFYECIYGKGTVSYQAEVRYEELETDGEYLLIPSNIRLISPFLIQFFIAASAHKGSGRVGVVNPCRRFNREINYILWGDTTSLKVFHDKMPLFEDDAYWNEFLKEECIIADSEMLNFMDQQRLVSSTRNMEERISFLEWIKTE